MKRLSGLFSAPRTHFQILSDLYLNYESQYLTFHIPVSAPYLILAGNVGQLADYDAYLSFLVRRCNLYEKVFLVLGALEFQGLSHAEGLQLARHMEEELATGGRLQILHRTRAELPNTNITLLGCTLWSNIPESMEAAVIKKAPEFDPREGVRWRNIADHTEEHFRDLDWLKSEVNRPTTSAGAESSSAPVSKLVVVTSFSPDLHHTLAPWQVQSPWSAAYGSDLLNATDWNSVKFWIHGTTGRTGKAKRFCIKVVSNQRGRVGEEEKGMLADRLSEKDKVDLFDVTTVIRV